MNPTVYRTSHQVKYELLRRVLRDAVQAGPGAAGGIGTVECQAVATLYMLLIDHPIDPQGRCRSCRRPGAVFGPRWRRCRVQAKAALWLHQLDEVLLLRLLAHELGLTDPTPPAAPGRSPASDPEGTDVLPAIELDLGVPLQTPAVSSPFPPRGPRGEEQPDRDHGGAGDDPEGLRSRRVPPEHRPPPQSGRSLLLTGGIT